MPYTDAVPYHKDPQKRIDAPEMLSRMYSGASFASCFHRTQKDLSISLPVVKFNMIS